MTNEEKHELLVGVSGRQYFAPEIPVGPIDNMEGFVASPVYTNVNAMLDETATATPNENVTVKDGDEVSFTFPGSISVDAIDRAIDFLTRLRAAKG